nr:MAG TPA: hypothetical protein [Caudoviricetes sp.]
MSASIEKTRDSLSDCQSALNTVFENLNDYAMEVIGRDLEIMCGDIEDMIFNLGFAPVGPLEDEGGDVA